MLEAARAAIAAATSNAPRVARPWSSNRAGATSSARGNLESSALATSTGPELALEPHGVTRSAAIAAASALASAGTNAHACVRQHAATSLAEIEKATLRLVALRASRNLPHAAARLGMAPVSLSRWLGRRELP